MSSARIPPGRLAAIAVVGAVVCTVCDHLHVIGGVLYYRHPDFWRQAWWVPPLFAASTLAMVASVPVMRSTFGKGARALRASPRVVAGEAVAFVTAYAFTAFAQGLPNVVLGVLVGWWVARVLRGIPTWLTLFALASAVAGPLVEAGISSTGLFAYTHPDFLGVPRWLPALYLHVGLLAGPTRRLLER